MGVKGLNVVSNCIFVNDVFIYVMNMTVNWLKMKERLPCLWTGKGPWISIVVVKWLEICLRFLLHQSACICALSNSNILHLSCWTHLAVALTTVMTNIVVCESTHQAIPQLTFLIYYNIYVKISKSSMFKRWQRYCVTY